VGWRRVWGHGRRGCGGVSVKGGYREVNIRGLEIGAIGPNFQHGRSSAYGVLGRIWIPCILRLSMAYYILTT
jgi:hypothetical protein